MTYLHLMFKEEADRHYARAAEWLKSGRPDFADGSIKKAAKWQDKGRAYDMLINGPFPKTQIDFLRSEAVSKALDRIASDIARELLYGSSGR